VNPFVALSSAIAIALVLRLAGIFRELLPDIGTLAALLAALQVLRLARDGTWPIAEWRQFVRTHAFGIGLFAVCVWSVLVRLPNFAGDLGHTPLDIDERRVAANVRQFFASGRVGHEHIEHYPGVVFWLFAASSLLSFLRGLSGGLVTAHATVLPVESFAHAARLANIWIAAATVLVTGLVGFRLSGPAAGVIGALIVAISPISIETTTMVRNDPGMVLAVMAATYAALTYYDEGKLGWIAAAGAFAGLAAAIKYSAVFALLPVAFAACSVSGARARMRACVVAVLMCGLAVGVSNHFVWADFPNLLRQLAAQYSFTGMGHRWSTGDPASVYVSTLVWAGPGWAMLLLAAGFAVYALSTGKPKLWIFISFPLVYMWFMTQRPLQVPRWVYPLVPFVALGGAAALVACLQAIRASTTIRPASWSRRIEAVVAVAIVAALSQPVWAGTVSFSRRINPPTHVLAETWIREHATPGTVALVGQGWLALADTPVVARRVPNLGAVLDAGIAQLGGCKWVIATEDVFEHPTLRPLGLLARFDADWSLGGNLGVDYRVYDVPDLVGTGICNNPAAKPGGRDQQ
jgi:4-amino-4-deoxy-L-arabinose transferase-like glycosyltransferase